MNRREYCKQIEALREARPSNAELRRRADRRMLALTLSTLAILFGMAVGGCFGDLHHERPNLVVTP